MEDKEYRKPKSICSLYRVSIDGNIYKVGTFTPLKKHKDSKGYLKINWIDFKTKKRNTAYVHKLVAECYCENILGFKRVKFLDGNKQNCNAENLEWF